MKKLSIIILTLAVLGVVPATALAEESPQEEACIAQSEIWNGERCEDGTGSPTEAACLAEDGAQWLTSPDGTEGCERASVSIDTSPAIAGAQPKPDPAPAGYGQTPKPDPAPQARSGIGRPYHAAAKPKRRRHHRRHHHTRRHHR